MTASVPHAGELLFDGTCSFCRRWILRWERRLAAAGVACRPYQEALSTERTGITLDEASRAIHLVEADGTIRRGAAAVLRAQARVRGEAWRWWLYRWVPLLAPLAEACYALVARNRTTVSRLVRWTHGSDLRPIDLRATRRLFVALLGLVYLAAFASIGAQIQGLLGSQGVTPAAELLARVRAVQGGADWLHLPTIFWWSASDRMLGGVCLAGMAGALLVVLGVAPRFLLLLLWAGYLSIVSVGDVFLRYQWDALLLETGLLALLFAPGGLRPDWRGGPAPSRVLLFLLRWLVFRLMFLSGVVKLASGDETWRDLSALTYHYWSQPLPHAVAHFVHHVPVWAHEWSARIMFAVELGAPWLVFAPRRLRLLGGAALAALLLLIAATGNYGFFVPLSLALCALLLDDRALAWIAGRVPFLRPRREADFDPASPFATAWSTARALATGVFALVVLLATTVAGLFRVGLGAQVPAPLVRAYAAVAPLHSLNAYGLFAGMTTTRLELEVEGSDDGLIWKPYVFRWKPGPLDRRPGLAFTHMPRLDWQMWFAALVDWHEVAWLQRFEQRLLEGAEPVLALLAANPFPDAPPRFVRARGFDYRFSTPAERATGIWWRRMLRGGFGPTYALESGRLVVVEY